MFNKESQLGLFWIENHKEETFQGEIQFAEYGFKLKIINRDFENISEDKILINGIIGNQPISFILINAPMKPRDIKIYYIYDVYFGVNCNTKEEREFKKIMFKINNINSVINLRSLKPNLPRDTPLKIKPSEPITIKMDNFTIEIAVDLLNNYGHWEHRGNGQKITFEESINIIIEYNESQNISTIYKDIIRIKRLFTLLTGKSEITELKGIKENQKINIITPELLKKFNTRLKIDSMKLNKNKIKKVFKSWLTNYDEMNSVYALFYSINESEVNPETLFLTYSQILENYHRQKCNGKYLTKEEFKPIWKEIKENIKPIIINRGFLTKILKTEFCHP